MKIEDTLPSGERISLTIEGGELDEVRILQVISMLKNLKEAQAPDAPEALGEGSLKDRIWRVIVENFGDGTWFSLRDLYNLAVKEIPGLKITSVSTYVTRLVSEGKLVKRGTKPNTRYCIKSMSVVRSP